MSSLLCGLENNVCLRHQYSFRKNHILAVANFDAHGLPLQYLTFDLEAKFRWEQVVFQTISLKLLLKTSLGLDKLSHVTIRGKEYTIVIVQQKQGFRAIAFHSEFVPNSLEVVEQALLECGDG